jgi:hypothetical protein
VAAYLILWEPCTGQAGLNGSNLVINHVVDLAITNTIPVQKKLARF